VIQRAERMRPIGGLEIDRYDRAEPVERPATLLQRLAGGGLARAAPLRA
jgi:hypothetical protein